MATLSAELVPEETKRDQRGHKITPAWRRLELVKAYRSSGMTMKQFARQEGINWLTLAKWSSQESLRTQTKPMQFSEMKLGLPAGTGWALEAVLPNGLVVRAASAAGLAELLTLVSKPS
jgi:transposase-like protein